jgi:hypothetical protein
LRNASYGTKFYPPYEENNPLVFNSHNQNLNQKSSNKMVLCKDYLPPKYSTQNVELNLNIPTPQTL